MSESDGRTTLDILDTLQGGVSTAFATVVSKEGVFDALSPIPKSLLAMQTLTKVAEASAGFGDALALKLLVRSNPPRRSHVRPYVYFTPTSGGELVQLSILPDATKQKKGFETAFANTIAAFTPLS
jgi:hypothetical protein